MDIKAQTHLNSLLSRYPVLESCKEDIVRAYTAISDTFKDGGKLLICGNGGSAADAEHMVGELMKGFKLRRKLSPELSNSLLSIDKDLGIVLSENIQEALPAIALDGHVALTTAYINDSVPALSFAQQVNGYGKPGDTLIGISTSGNSENVIYAAVISKAKGLKVIGLTGEGDSRLSSVADICIRVPESETYKIQELHLPVYHCLCLMLESTFFEN